MRFAQLTISLLFITLLIGLNQIYGSGERPLYGGLSWLGWISILLGTIGVGLVVLLNDSARAVGFFGQKDEESGTLPVRTLTSEELQELGIKKYRGEEYPHPVIFNDRCIGCQACVDACPHDVLAIVDGTAAVVAADQCMEDTSCEAECPVSPKACIVVNTTKEVRSRPMPDRNGSTYETNVRGCYIIGDVSGVPLIKNAVKEGAEVIGHIADELAAAPPEPLAEYDVAIIGIGPGGASAAVTAREKGLRYVGIEQEKTLSTIEKYPKGKYIFFKPDTRDWTGGLKTVGLGLSDGKYDPAGKQSPDERWVTEIGPELEAEIARQGDLIVGELLPLIPDSLKGRTTPELAARSVARFGSELRDYLSHQGQGGWRRLYETYYLPDRKKISADLRRKVIRHLETRIPGDQRENILDIWLGYLGDQGVVINERESCSAVEPADDGDYFKIRTVRVTDKIKNEYRARRVVLAIGLRGAPNRLGLPEEDMRIVIDGKRERKVRYGLNNPARYRGRAIAVVGGGNSAVEAAVDLVSRRAGQDCIPRPPEEMNRVTLIVRSYLAPTVKFGNKHLLYKFHDEGLLDIRFGVEIREIRENEVVLEDVQTKKVVDKLDNDLIFALIGGERPDRFLRSIGIDIS